MKTVNTTHVVKYRRSACKPVTTVTNLPENRAVRIAENLILMEPSPVHVTRDVRWQQRLHNYKKAFLQLQKFIDKGILNELEEQGLIQSFEYTFELAWNVMKDYYTFQGVGKALQGSRDAIRLAFNQGLIEDGEGWMNMVESRIKSSHTYEEETAKEIAAAIFNKYYYLFGSFLQTMEDISRK